MQFNFVNTVLTIGGIGSQKKKDAERHFCFTACFGKIVQVSNKCTNILLSVAAILLKKTVIIVLGDFKWRK